MQLNHSHILEARKLRDNHIILCYIQVADRLLEYYHGQVKPHKTNRWMESEHWASFDKNLEMLFDQPNSTKSLVDITEHTFRLNELINVRVKPSHIPVTVLKQSIDNADTWDIYQAFDFFIEYKDINTATYLCGITNEDHEYEPLSISTTHTGVDATSNTPTYVPSVKIVAENAESITSSRQSHEERYSPKPVVDLSPDKIDESPTAVPEYRAMRMKSQQEVKKLTSKKFKPEANSDEVESRAYVKDRHGEDTAHKLRKKKKTKSDEKSKSTKHLDERITRRTDYAKRRETGGGGSSKTRVDVLDDKHDDKIIEKVKRRERIASTENRNIESDDEHSSKKSNSHKREYSEKAVTREFEPQNEEVNDTKYDSNDNIATDTSTKYETRKRNMISGEPRRSSRSPIKPVRFISDSQENRSSKSISPRYKPKTSKTNEDLFGSDDEDLSLDDFATKSDKTQKLAVPKTPKPIVSESAKKKRKRHRSPDCNEDKKSIGKWLSKKVTPRSATSTSSSSSKNRQTKSHSVGSKSPTQLVSRSLSPSLSKEEIEEKMFQEKQQMEHNHKINEVLKELAGPIPAKVDILTIHDLSLSDILDSFEKHKPKLDEIFKKKAKYPQVKGWGGIDHYFVMSLIDQQKPLKMMNKLRDVYEPDFDGALCHTSLYANAMMPEWIICLFMDKHKMTRDESIRHVKAQEDYKLHLEAQLENTITLDNSQL